MLLVDILDVAYMDRVEKAAGGAGHAIHSPIELALVGKGLRDNQVHLVSVRLEQHLVDNVGIRRYDQRATIYREFEEAGCLPLEYVAMMLLRVGCRRISMRPTNEHLRTRQLEGKVPVAVDDRILGASLHSDHLSGEALWFDCALIHDM